jgi:hypothetical protein
MFSFGLFSSMWNLIANVSEHSVCSSFTGEWLQSMGMFEKFVVAEQVLD